MAKNEHLVAGGRLRARLTRSHDYRQRGHLHISGLPERCGIYGGLEQIQDVLKERGTPPSPRTVARASPQHAERYTFTYESNFKRAQSPYINQAHHLLPEEAFCEKFFTGRQLRILRAIPYDINEGTNIIFLPSLMRDMAFHRLPSHSGRHPRYTALIVEDMEEVRLRLNAVTDKDLEHEHWSPPEDIKHELLKLEEEYWKHLVSCGPIPINRFKKPAPGKPARKPGAHRIMKTKGS